MIQESKQFRTQNLQKKIFNCLKVLIVIKQKKIKKSRKYYEDNITSKTFYLLKMNLKDRIRAKANEERLMISQTRKIIAKIKKRNIFRALKKILKKSKMVDKEALEIYKTQLKSRAIKGWITSLKELKTENFFINKKHKLIISNFQRTHKLQNSFLSWHSYTDKVRNQYKISEKKKEMMSKVKDWLKEYKNDHNN